jgi:hypothetical protein
MSRMPLLVVESTALLDVDGDDSHGGKDRP